MTVHCLNLSLLMHQEEVTDTAEVSAMSVKRLLLTLLIHDDQ